MATMLVLRIATGTSRLIFVLKVINNIATPKIVNEPERLPGRGTKWHKTLRLPFEEMQLAWDLEQLEKIKSFRLSVVTKLMPSNAIVKI